MPSRAAAFFDLDRTLVAESTGFQMIDALADAGLLSETEQRLTALARPVTRALARLYSETGETWLWMRLTGGGVGRLKRWTVSELREVARLLSERLEAHVYAEARSLIDWHRREGRLVCVATSTGRELIAPLTEKLGVDCVVATEYEEEAGRLTGAYVDAWLWGPDKARAVRAFAEREGVDLADSYAYSDSSFDRHLLQAVGHPRAVNPDPALRALARVRGWPILTFRRAPGAPVLTAHEFFDVARALLHPALLPFALDLEGAGRIPRSGGVILASNHRSYLDGLVLAAVASRAGRKVRFLGKREIFDAPVLGQFARAAGQIPVDRGTGSTRPIQEALEGLAIGEAIAIFPQATIPRGEAFFEHRLRGKTGVARLGLASGAPVVPVAIWGTERIWPRSRRLPPPAAAVLKPAVHVRVGEPMALRAPASRRDERATLERLTQKVMDTIWAMLPEEVRRPPAATPEQVAMMTPPGMTPERAETAGGKPRAARRRAGPKRAPRRTRSRA